ncbi:hypothetical protein HWV62_9607 [Athelia sp. TMB]|nr:hypothetical protein HWV62_9607 [Athelia sp. TMB]
MLSLSELLNPEVAPDFEHPSLTSPSLFTISPSTPSSRGSSPTTSANTTGNSDFLSVQDNVSLNRQTTLARLYTHARNSSIEYPETDAHRPIGHLFEIDPSNWFNPRLGFAYSQGEPCHGNQTIRYGKEILCKLLVDKEGRMVPCKLSQYTCQGCKVCPYAEMESMCTPHVAATRDTLKLYLQELQKLRNVSDPQQALFAKTLTVYRSYRTLGCLGPVAYSSLIQSAIDNEDDDEDEWCTRLRNIRRGHDPKSTCSGKLLFEHDQEGRAFVRCEYFSPHVDGTRDHLFTYNPGSGLYNTEYLEALFHEDAEAVSKFELAAKANGYGPLAPCTYVANHTSVRVNCPCEHRTTDGRLDLGEVVNLRCESTFRSFEPLEEYREACPRILIICRNAHTHPLPLPSKTPPSVRQEVLDLLRSTELDLPDLTACRFLRHPVTRTYLQKRLPGIRDPCPADLHISLANCEHIKSYISQVQTQCFPFGTGWDGLLHLKRLQDQDLPPEDHYIRYAEEIPIHSLPVHDEDETEHSNPADKMLRIVVCMSPESSQRLAAAQYLQSDIAFKRVSGFLEFEIGGLHRDANMAIPYCRVYINRQSAAAHAIVFQKIEELVLQDTGKPLRWRHLHADSLDEHTGILQWAGDQHGGQAKGLGLHLQSLARNLPGRRDLHEPDRMLSELTEYEHLQRLFRLCSVHVERNIDASPVPQTVKKKMRSLICVTHPDFEGTLRAIAAEGGKKGAAWVDDKLRAKFALPGICWEKSHIPLVIWQVGDATTNTLEALHADVNSEGKFCSLLGGLKKVVARRKAVALEDTVINTANKKLKSAHDDAVKAKAQLSQTLGQPQSRRSDGRYTQEVARAEKRYGAAEASYAKALASSMGARGIGSGRVRLLLPADHTSGR